MFPVLFPEPSSVNNLVSEVTPIESNIVLRELALISERLTPDLFNSDSNITFPAFLAADIF